MFRCKIALQVIAVIGLWALPWLALVGAFAPRDAVELRLTRAAGAYWIDVLRGGRLQSTARLMDGPPGHLELTPIDVDQDGRPDLVGRWIGNGRIWTQVWL